MATVLFINRTDLLRNSILDGNVDSDKYIQFIKLAQVIHIQQIMGTKLYNGLATAIPNIDLAANAEWYSRRFIDFMSFNQTTYPEYTSNVNNDLYPSTDSTFNGWVL